MSDQAGVCEVLGIPGDVGEVWPGRFFVDIVTGDDFPHHGATYQGVNLRLFRPDGDMPESKARDLLAVCGFTEPDVYLIGYVGQTFDAWQAGELATYLIENWPVSKVVVSPATMPRENLASVYALPLGGGEGHYRFSNAAGYPLRFNVWGYYDLCNAPAGGDELCPRCGASMQGTHAPWCEFDDGTPVPDDMVEFVKALEDCKRAFWCMTAHAPGNNALLWGVKELSAYILDGLIEAA